MARDHDAIEELYKVSCEIKSAESPNKKDRLQVIQAYWMQRIFEVLSAIEMDLRKGTRP